MNQIELTINGKKIIIKKLVLGKYVELLKAIENFPKLYNGVKGKSEDEIIQNIPFLISAGASDVFKIIHIVTELPVEEIEKELSAEDLVDIVSAAFTVNNFAGVYEKIKKATARPDAEGPQN